MGCLPRHRLGLLVVGIVTTCPLAWAQAPAGSGTSAIPAPPAATPPAAPALPPEPPIPAPPGAPSPSSPAPGAYPPGYYPPGAYPQGAYPPGSYPPGYPAQPYPPGAYPPGAYPPGAYPPGAYPPGAYPPGYYPYPPGAYEPAPPPPKLDPLAGLPANAAVKASPFIDIALGSYAWSERFEVPLSIGANVGGYLGDLVRVVANVSAPLESQTDQERTLVTGGFIDVTPRPKILFGASVGVAAMARRGFVLAPGLTLQRTGFSEYGTLIGASVPLEWVTRIGLRIAVEGSLGVVVGGNKRWECHSECQTPPDASDGDRKSGLGGGLRFSFGYGFGYPKRQNTEPAPEPGAPLQQPPAQPAAVQPYSPQPYPAQPAPAQPYSPQPAPAQQQQPQPAPVAPPAQ